MDERKIQQVIARTRPATIPPEYARPPAPMPNVPLQQSPCFWAQVIDGRDFGMGQAYPDYQTWYIDEIAPPPFQTMSDPFYPSRTRDEANNWIETIAWNLFNYHSFWPIAFYSRILVYPWAGTGFGEWATFNAPMAARAVVTDVTADGEVYSAEWCDGSGASYDMAIYPKIFIPSQTNPWGNSKMYPFAQVGDVVTLLPVSIPNPGFTSWEKIEWMDMTPRIRLPNQNMVGASTERPVYLDLASGHGKPWILDTDTDT